MTRAPICFDAVVFDLDGVLTDTARYHYLAWKRLADSLGIHFDEAANEHLKGIDRMGSLNLILGDGAGAYSPEKKIALADKKNDHYRQLIATMTEADLLPGARDALLLVKASGLKTGLASVSKNAMTVVEALGIVDLLDDIVDAATITHGKPHPEIFLTAAAHLGVPPARCLGVEDAIAGVRAIKAAGMVALGVGDPAVLTEADMVIPGLHRFTLDVAERPA
jgi:beta-phosphoglucomutase